MKKQVIEVAVKKENGIIKEIGKSSMLMPKPNFKGGTINWFDDSKLIRKEGVTK